MSACPRCGVTLDGSAEQLCPACLLRIALERDAPDATHLQTDGDTPLTSGGVSPPPVGRDLRSGE